MLADLIINTQEIREHVVSIGRKLRFVTDLIIATDDKINCHLQSNSVEAVFHNCIDKPLKPATSNGKKTIQKSNANKLCIDLCSSDSDEEWSDNWWIARNERMKANHGKSISELRAPLLASIELRGNAAAPNTDSNSSCAVVDIEILEENNNDPNNNLDSIESFQDEGANLISALDAAFKMESAKRFSPTPGCSKDFGTANISVREFARCWSSPTPGCSKDADDTNHLSIEEITAPTPGCSTDFNLADDMYQGDPSECSSSLTQNYSINSDDIVPRLVDEKLQEEAVQICSLLPKFTYQRVYAALCKNPDAENRVELCLWDLLPWKRPTARFPIKRKFIDDNAVGDCKKVSPKLSIVEQKEMEFNLCDDDISVMNDYDLLDGSLNGQDALNIGGSKDETTMVHENYENNEPGKDKVSLAIQNGILQPAKLIIKRGPVHALHVTSPNRSILSPSKLTYVTAQCNDEAGKTASTYDKKCKDKRVICNNGAPIARNVFLAPSTNLPPNDSNNSKEHAFHKYMRYLEFMQTTKREHSAGKPIIFKGKLKHVDIEARKEVREAFLRGQFTNSNRIAAQLGNNKKVPKTVIRVNTNCDINVPNDPSNEENLCAVKSIDMLRCDVPGNEEMNLQMPSTSTKSEGPNTELPDIVTVDLTAATVGAERLSPIASTSTGSKGSNDVSPRTASTERAIADGPSTSALIQFAGNRATPSPTVAQAASIGVASCNKLSAAEPSATSAAKPIKLTGNDRLLAARSSITTLGLRPSNDSVVEVGERKVLRGVRRKEINPNRNVILHPDFEMFNDGMSMLHKDTNRIKSPQLKDSVKASVTSTKSLQELHGFAVEAEKICPVQKAIARKDDEQYLYLSGVFPDADSTYLRKIVVRMNGNQEEIMEFIQSQWENPTYPTKEEKLRRTRITDQQKQYISNFDVKQFLEIFPDPFKHFEDPTRECKNNANAFTFLKFQFKYHKHATLKNIYESCNYHLNSTATIVEQVPPDRQSARVTRLWEKCPSEDIPLLQECAFIMHKAEIRKYFEKLKKKEDAEFRRLKENQELLECQCCYDNECMPSKCSTCNDGHIFCNACIVRGTESKLAQGETHIPCFVTCDEKFSLATLQKVLSPTQFSILIGKRQEEEVMAAGLEGLVSCPFCHFATIPPPEDKIFKCLNPACMKESCRLCKELNHIPLKCYEKETDKARLFLEEKMTEALVRKCHKCNRPYYKEDGCNKITCSCGALMCYICDKPVTGYDHFNDGYRGRSNPCPLMSDNHLINNATVEAVAKKTIEYIQQKDPNIKLTAPTVLPQRYLNNSALSDRVSKIAKFDT